MMVSLAATLALEVSLAGVPQQFDIPAQPVADALRTFAALTDMQLLYQYDAVKDARTSRLVGQFGKAEALRQLLWGTGLEAVFSSDGVATIRRARRGPPTHGEERPRGDGKLGRSGHDLSDDAAASARGSQSLDAAAARNGDSGLEEVTVTGSRIRRVVLDALQPTMIIDRRTIEDRAWASVADAFAELPAFGPPGNSPIGGQSPVAVGQSFVNFLGLGSQRTLTLVDGRRFVAANSPSIISTATPGLQVDFNTIPAALVERIEIVGVGGAPVYGSDAVAGTVNIVRRRDFEGLNMAAQVGTTEHGGATRRRVQGVYGRNLAEARGNVAASFEYSEQDGLLALDRPAIAAGLSFQAPADPASPYRQVLVPNSRAVIVNYNGFPLTAPVANQTENFRFAVKDEQGQPLQFAPDGSLVAFDPGTRTGSPIFFSGGDGLNLAAATSLLTTSRRALANFFVDYELGRDVSLDLEGWFAHTRSEELVNQPVFNEASFATPDETPTHVLSGPIPLRLDNPFLPAASRATIARNMDLDGDGAPDPLIDFDRDGAPETIGFWLAKGHQDLARGNSSTSTQDLYRAIAALRGDAMLAGRAWHWDISYNHGRTHSASMNVAVLNTQFNRALDAVQDPASGRIRCRDAGDPACVPLNLFGYGAPSPQAIAYVTAPTTARSAIEQRVLSANASGSPFSVPAGTVRVAAGMEYRRESSAFEPDDVQSSGRWRGAPLMPISGSFHTGEIYAETVVPLIGPQQQLAALQSLDFESAVRYVDHSTAGSDVTWTAGLRLAPHRDVRLRANYTESIRAPAITELFLPTSMVFGLAADPCDRRLLNQGPNPQRRAANCALDGVPQPFSSTVVNASQPMTIEGNRGLQNETAVAWTVGLTLQPTIAPGLALSADWIDIRLRNAIERFNATAILQSCYDSPNFPDAEVCGRFRRGTDGQVLDVRTGFLNAGIVDFSGLTAEIAYDAQLRHGGAVTLGLHHFYLDRLDVSATGVDFNPGAGELNNSRNRSTVQLAYRHGPMRSSLYARYVGPAVFNREDAPADRDVRGVKAFWTLNTSVGYAVSDAVSLQFNVDNVFDEAPPFASMTGALGLGANSAPATYFSGLLGRSYALSAQMSF